MQVTIFGATGMVGRQLIIHCLAKHYKVIAFGRNVSGLIDADLKSDQLTAIQGYVFNDADVKKALTGSQAVLSALGGRFDGQDKARSLGMKKVIQGMV
ncbi:MAG TPA: NAD(P)H-binding protein, partial [Phnomibacter sp.]|nr:NAD(P)H-binding protein [Phnomibacter sp.]